MRHEPLADGEVEGSRYIGIVKPPDALVKTLLYARL